MSATVPRRLTVLCLGSAALAGLALIVAANPVQAEKVGVAAAVKPDAFSEGNEIKIGNSVFYNQRINTSGEGLVQVLLVDGSTFTVGPGSDLVIDKFVYDPKKGQGEIVASFGKGVMRFVGGKLSKNEGGVTVNTPSGALAIRGGMFHLSVTPGHMLASFLFGDEMTIKSHGQILQRIYQVGYTYDNGLVRPTRPEDTAVFMKALSGGGKVVVHTPNGGKTNLGSNFLKNLNTAETEEEGTQTIIVGQLASQEHDVGEPNEPKPPSQPPSGGGGGGGGGTMGGYAGGIYTQISNDSDDPPVGSLANADPSEIGIVYNEETHEFSGAKFVLYADQGGGVKIGFEPYEPYDSFSSTSISNEDTSNEEPPIPGDLIVGLADVDHDGPDIGSIEVYHETNEAGQLADPATQVTGGASLVGGSGEILCQSCNFMKWGYWATSISFDNGSAQNNGQTHVDAIGFWVAGNLTTTAQLAELGDLRNNPNASATYAGRAIATVANNLDGDHDWDVYIASGNLNMDWNFASRKGNLEISQFDTPHIDGGLTFQGEMNTPGVLKNKFGGPLALTSPNIPENLSDVQGFAQGSFVKGPDHAAQGVIGNWNVGGQNYGATGIFAGGKTPGAFAGKH